MPKMLTLRISVEDAEELLYVMNACIWKEGWPETPNPLYPRTIRKLRELLKSVAN